MTDQNTWALCHACAKQGHSDISFAEFHLKSQLIRSEDPALHAHYSSVNSAEEPTAGLSITAGTILGDLLHWQLLSG